MLVSVLFSGTLSASSGHPRCLRSPRRSRSRSRSGSRCLARRPTSHPPTLPARPRGRRRRRHSAGTRVIAGLRGVRASGMTRIGILAEQRRTARLDAVIHGIVRKASRRAPRRRFRYGCADVLDGAAIDLSMERRYVRCTRGGDPRPPRPTLKDDTDGTALVREGMAKGVEALIPIGGKDTWHGLPPPGRDSIPVISVRRRSTTTSPAPTSRSASHSRPGRDRRDQPPAHDSQSHNRVLVVEVMAATPTGSPQWDQRRRDADPRARSRSTSTTCAHIRARHARRAPGLDRRTASEDAAEGRRDRHGRCRGGRVGHIQLSGVAAWLEQIARTGVDAHGGIGHVQRSRTPAPSTVCWRRATASRRSTH